jgi:hypothetical protein
MQFIFRPGARSVGPGPAEKRKAARPTLSEALEIVSPEREGGHSSSFEVY